ncbi:hypothetical protein JKG47_12850 [Acidithiobacillus sp. MC6.1]|nr:hypothetical protein [Acidithiobacillus sp. MC6.1]
MNNVNKVVLYEAFRVRGPYWREAILIDELPTPESRISACRAATPVVAGLPASRQIPFGAPVYTAFGMTLPEAKRHARSALLLKRGCDLPLRM